MTHMKKNRDKKIILTLFFPFLLIMLFANCHDDVKPATMLGIKLGHSSPSGIISFVEFVNQNQIPASKFQADTKFSLGGHGMFIALAEENINCSAIGYTNSRTSADVANDLQFIFNITTNSDKETFDTATNGWTFGRSMGSGGNNGCSIGVTYFIPIKFTNTAIPNNDTLEINLAQDTIKYRYNSLYTSKSVDSKFILN